jgi:hypothetical protein
MPEFYMPLDPNITNTVHLINKLGFETCDSGDGVAKLGTDLECQMIPTPHVILSVPDRDLLFDLADGLYAALEGEGVVFGPTQDQVEEAVGVQEEGITYGDGVFIEASYSPGQGKGGVVMITGLHDELLAQIQAR